jgi:dihydrofolate synthase/folylpolyglutamate synthase
MSQETAMKVVSRAAEAALDDWLAHIDSVCAQPIDMGLERVDRVRRAMGLAPKCPVITVAGTNGKGSTCALLEAILSRAGYSVGLYTSPHFLRHNERIRLDGAPVADAPLCTAFDAVERARGDVPLTYFEFGTLAAMHLFIAAEVDVVILEVGLGGRLDAVNVFDAHCAVVTSVDLDHMDYLGDTREAIGFEKAGIFRRDTAAICADPDVPASVSRHAADIGAHFRRLGRDFGYSAGLGEWRYWGPGVEYEALPMPRLFGDCQLMNASAAIAALGEIGDRLPVSVADIRAGLRDVSLPGRFAIYPGTPTVILDIAHNPQAATTLAGNLARLPCQGRTYAVFAMLKDKDIGGVIRAVREQIDVWVVAGIQETRGANAAHTLAAVEAGAAGAETVTVRTVAEAFAEARRLAGPADRIVVFGSFHTVAPVMKLVGLSAV